MGFIDLFKFGYVVGAYKLIECKPYFNDGEWTFVVKMQYGSWSLLHLDIYC